MLCRARRTGRMVMGAVGAAALIGSLVACAEDEGGSSFEGEDVELVVPYGPGGGYDVYARAVAPYLGECLGAQVVVRNEPGAGGLLATSETAVAEPDGLRLQILNLGGFAAAQIAEADGVQFDLSEFSYLGRLANAPDALAVAADSEIASFDDVISSREPVRFVSTGPGSQESLTPNVLAAAYGFPLEITTGFSGSGEARTAVVSGDADIHALPLDSQLSAVESGEIRPVLLVDNEANDLSPDIPLVTEFEPGEPQGQSLVDSLVTQSQLGRAIAAPPGVPADRLAELRRAFDCAMNDEQLLGELEDQQRPVNVLDGPQIAEQVNTVLDPTPEFKAVVEESF